MYNNMKKEFRILQKHVTLFPEMMEDYLVLIEIRNNEPVRTYIVRIPTNHIYVHNKLKYGKYCIN